MLNQPNRLSHLVVGGMAAALLIAGAALGATKVPIRQDIYPADRAHWADGYVWANDPTNLSYTPNTFYSFNRTGGEIFIQKPFNSTGLYHVQFAGLSAFLGARSTVHLSGYFGDGKFCEPAAARLTSDGVNIHCFDATTGAAANAYYTVLVTRNYTDLAFAFANQPTSTDYAPAGGASWNPGGAIRVFRTAVGTYQVKFKGLGALVTSNGGDMQVTAVGKASVHCNVGNWGDSPDLDVNVICYNHNGDRVDARFNVLFLLPSDHLAYAYADQPTTPSYTPDPFYSSNPGGGTITITRLATGRYSISWPGFNSQHFDGGDVQVTAYYADTTQCKVESWGSSTATVRCFTPDTGTPIDTLYTVLYGS